MYAQIKIEMDNAAFEDQPATELGRILRELAAHIEDGGEGKFLMDLNGNKVGVFMLRNVRS